MIGSWSIEFDAVSGSGGERLNYSFTAEIGKEYRVQYKYQGFGTDATSPQNKSWQGCNSPSSGAFPFTS